MTVYLRPWNCAFNSGGKGTPRRTIGPSPIGLVGQIQNQGLVIGGRCFRLHR